MNRLTRSALGFLLVVTLPIPAFSQDPFAAGVRPTDPLSPADEQKALLVPDGFEIQFVAAEPDIFKPMNMAFDERGRMWITDSLEYPWAAPLDKPARDSVKILHDTDGDGKADVIKTFADGLNIPIGIYPYPSRKDEATGKTIQGAIVWSIPFIWDLRDTDGDDICDERIKLYGPFGYERDTHGMCNAFRRGFDGWIYACHGFNNISKVAGKDGNVVEMSSGNTFRFRMDGSRIEHFSHGQVNPFGMCFDPLFNIFTADCHTKPVTQILRGAYYPSFGKPHDGLGFVPPIMNHVHGSTANCGIVAYYGGHFPKEWEGKFFTGNVMTSRVNVDRPEYHGSTILAKEEPDFVISKDPWFRPVDLQCGPDGALYIADFYNKIIGHYEVDLKHPGRDRHRGRIWRVVHKARQTEEKDSEGVDDLHKLGSGFLATTAAGGPNLTVNLLALNLLCDRWNAEDRAAVMNFIDILKTWPNEKDDQCFHIVILWAGLRTGTLKKEHLEAAMKSKSRDVRVHAMKVMSELPKAQQLQRLGLMLPFDFFEERDKETDHFVLRAAADATAHFTVRGLSGEERDWDLLPLLDRIGNEDHHLRYVLRWAMREVLAQNEDFSGWDEDSLATRIGGAGWAKKVANQVAELALAVPSTAAGDYLVDYLTRRFDTAESSMPFVQHAARYAPAMRIAELSKIVRTRFANDTLTQLNLFGSIRAGLQQRGEPIDAPLREWASELAGKLLESSHGASLSWANEVVPGKPKADNPWELRARVSQDGDKGSLFFDSLVKGEQLTGLYRSEPFELPAKLSFWCAGHNGLPGAPFKPKNYIRLRDASTHALLRETMPPRNDTAQKFEWDLTELVGQAFQPDPNAPREVDGKKSAGSRSSQPGKADLRRGYIELLDADEGNAYAWLAVGRFSMEALNPNRVVDQQIAAANLIGDFKISDFKTQISGRLISRETDSRAKEAFARAVLTLQPDSILAALAPLIADVSLPDVLREQIAAAVVDRRLSTDSGVRGQGSGVGKAPLLVVVVQAIPERLQLRLAESLASDAAGTDALLRLAKDGLVSPRLLTRPTVKQRLDAIKSEAIHKQVAELTATLPDDDAALRQLIEQRRTAFLAAQSHAEAAQRPSVEAGAAMFAKHCAACHQVAGKGTVLGPQLDGIGQRGLERLLEDVIDPNRNVDVNFRTTTIVDKNGKIFSGLIRREQGATLVLSDNKGKEFTVTLADIDERVKSSLSLMPANVGEILTEREFLDLVSYLLSQRSSREPTGAEK